MNYWPNWVHTELKRMLKPIIYISLWEVFVPAAGLEPARPLSLRILSPLCLPFHHAGTVRNIGKSWSV